MPTTKLKKPIREGYILKYFNYIIFLKSKTVETIKRSVVAGGGGARKR